jgi:hypothetical protein
LRIVLGIAAIAAIGLSDVTVASAQNTPSNPLTAAAAAAGNSAQGPSSQPDVNANVTISKTKQKTIEIPAGTTVLVALDRKLSSQSDKTDDPFTFTAAQNIVVNGMLVIAKGAPGAGHILNASRAGMFGKTGILQPAFDWITAVDGEKIHMTGTQSSVGGVNIESNVAGSVAGSMAGAVIPFAGLGSMAMGGKKAEIGTERPYPIYVSSTVHVVSDQAAKIEDGFAH